MIRAWPWLSLSVLALVLCSLAAAQNASLGLQPRRTENAGDVNEGRMVVIGGLFGEQRIACTQCHGLDGAGDSSGAFPRLSGQSGWYLYKALHDYAAGLRPNDIMGPIANSLSDRQKRSVAAYYASLKPLPLASEASADVSTRQIGGAIAAVGAPWQGVPACNGCHDVDAPGALPIYPSLAGQYAPYTRLQLMLWKQGQRAGDPMSIMESIAKAMTQDQIDAVALYYAAVKPKAHGAAGRAGRQAMPNKPDDGGTPEIPSGSPSGQSVEPSQAGTTGKPDGERAR